MMGHVSDKGLIELQKQCFLCDDKISKINFFKYCMLGKHYRLAFKMATPNTKRILEYVHTDLWGPSKVPSHGGSRYFLSLIDDFSKKLFA